MADPLTAAAAAGATTTAAVASTGPSLTTVFLAAAVDVALFAWMHFTASGMAFGASVAAATGMVPSASSLGATAATSATGAPVLAL